MRHSAAFPLLLALVAPGCGPSATELREQTLSTLNTEADRWDGGPEFATNAGDAYGGPLVGVVTKGTLHHVLELRSHGPDGLPKNSDDLVVSRRERHGESSMTAEAAKATEAVTTGAARGFLKGAGQAIGFGRDGKDEE